jgi:hypothetical protein
MESLDVNVEVWKAENHVLAFCPELGFAARGNDEEDAKSKLLSLCREKFKELAKTGNLKNYAENNIKEMRPEMEIGSVKSLVAVDKFRLEA